MGTRKHRLADRALRPPMWFALGYSETSDRGETRVISMVIMLVEPTVRGAKVSRVGPRCCKALSGSID